MKLFLRIGLACAVALTGCAIASVANAEELNLCQLGRQKIIVSQTAVSSCNASCVGQGYLSGRMLADDGFSSVACCCTVNTAGVSPSLDPPSSDVTNPFIDELPDVKSSYGGGAASCEEIITAKRAVTGTLTDDQMRDICNGFYECNSHSFCVALSNTMACNDVENSIAVTQTVRIKFAQTKSTRPVRRVPDGQQDRQVRAAPRMAVAAEHSMSYARRYTKFCCAVEPKIKHAMV